ncbi:MAG: hypothetical protein ABSD96_21055 [Candidatus Korobacteraceae bacterium]|jgi:hypothetical protein
MRLRILVFFILGAIVQAHAGAALLLEEPFGKYGYLNPTGHAAIYLTRVCAASPTLLRRCEVGEPGVVISRYFKIAGYDWMAIPLIPYLYAVDNVQEIPQTVDANAVRSLRDAYRRKHLLALAPDDPAGQMPEGDWVQLVGSSYDRKIYGFEIETGEQQDDALIRQFNRRPNKSHFNLFFHNCANFAGAILNRYYPGSVHRSFISDAGMLAPKQVAKSLVSYSKRHPELELTRFVIPQVPGSIHRSDSVDGVIESVLKTKKVSLPLAVLHPVIAGGLAAAYLTEGRFNPKRDAAVLDIGEVIQEQTPDKGTRPVLPRSDSDGLPGSSDARIPAPAAQAGPQ